AEGTGVRHHCRSLHAVSARRPPALPVHRLRSEARPLPHRLRHLHGHGRRRHLARADGLGGRAHVARQPPRGAGEGMTTASAPAQGRPSNDWPPLRALKRALRRVFDPLERGAERLFSPALNPLAQLGAISFFLFWVVAVSGVYLFIFFDTGIVDAYSSVEWISGPHWYHAGVMRSFHRYASDLMVVSVAIHLLREFSLDRYRGTRWFSWFTGIPLIWFLYVSGITGYWLVWDMMAQYVALVSAKLLDVFPI